MTNTSPHRRLTGDEYMALLQQRQDAWEQAQATKKIRLKFPPLLEWFIQAGDENLVDPAILTDNPPTPEGHHD